jgi:CRISPR/Cas system endoribonuclease Cas6 (RAMP superfamily)
MPPATQNLDAVKRSEDTQWSAEPEEPMVEYDSEIEEEVEEKNGSVAITAIALGGLVVTGALGWVVYRGLSEI